MKFYREALDRVLALNLRGAKIKEKTAFLLVKKIVGNRDNKYVDLRCPCGAGLGQLAYDHDGGIYTCDEGRMLAGDGDLSFRLGSVREDTYAGIIHSGPVKACAISSSLDLQPSCSRCAYRPYCGVCPVYNYHAQGSLWGDMPANTRCLTLKGVFETVFDMLKDRKGCGRVFEKWLHPG